MKKHLLSSLLSSAMVLSCLVACSSGTETTTTTTAATTAATTQAATVAQTTTQAKEEEPITIELWHKDTGVKEGLYQKYIDQYMEDHPHVNVVVTQTNNDTYKEKLPISFTGNAQPDVFFTWGGSWLKQFIDAGHVMDLTGLVETDSFYETTLTNAIFDDSLYGVPLGLDISFVYYNKEIFNTYGIEVPETFDELLSVCETLKSNNVTPFVLANQPKWPASFYYMYLVDRIGGPEAIENAVSRTGAFNDDVFVEAGEKVQQLAELGVFNDGFNGIAYDSGPGRQLLYTEQCAMMVLSNTFVNLMRAEYPDFEEKMGIFPFPTVDGGVGDASNIVGIASPVWSVSQKTEHPEECVELIKYLTSQEMGQDFANITGSQSARKDVSSEDPFVQQLEIMTKEAANMQSVYDQTLPSEIIEIHYNTVQGLLAQTMTPQEAADAVEEVAKAVYDN